jgi:hypothetical protein
VLLALVGALLLPLDVGAKKKERWGPDSITLRTNGQTQAAGLWYLTWANEQDGGDTCVILNADGTGAYPEAITHQVGDEVKIRLVKRRRPVDALITGYQAVDGDGRPIGPGEEIPFTLVRHRDAEGKTRAWHLVFTPASVGDLYLDAYAEWDDSCGPRQGLWPFHIETVEVDPPA